MNYKIFVAVLSKQDSDHKFLSTQVDGWEISLLT